ncbi:hypothetical protein B0H14DRAFT_3453430 [Mycena olivaceomarginata]|nr:hypothetical protein B0H14DRAFT_3453430 [Mycena olivaceomarginata]
MLNVSNVLITLAPNGGVDSDDVAKVLASLGAGDDGPEADSEGSEWTPGDAVGKVLALTKQIRMSPQARAFFSKCCSQASLYKCLDRCLILRKAIDLFVNLADDSDEVPDLRNKQYRNYTLSKLEWQKKIERIIPTLEFLIKRWKTMATQPKFGEIKDALLEGVKSLKKWFHRAETTSGAYFICLVLNPAIKDVCFRTHWGAEEYRQGMKALGAAFDRYHAAAAQENKHTEMPAVPVQPKPAPLHRYGSSFLLDAVNSVQQAERARADPR